MSNAYKFHRLRKNQIQYHRITYRNVNCFLLTIKRDQTIVSAADSHFQKLHPLTDGPTSLGRGESHLMVIGSLGEPMIIDVAVITADISGYRMIQYPVADFEILA